jgi:spore maturation protein CgeB
MRFVFFGLSIASAWGSGHATTYRGLIRELHRRGHHSTFYERRTEWYDNNCDLPQADYCDIRRYRSWPPPDAGEAVAAADVVVLGSFAGAGYGDGVAIAEWLPRSTKALLVYYDIDTPRTLAAFRENGRTHYLLRSQLAYFDLVLSFAGGPVLDELRRWGARRVEPFYCAIDPELHRPAAPVAEYRCDLGYMGTYDATRQDVVEELFLAPARLCPQRRFVLAGAEYPAEVLSRLPPNVARYVHVNPQEHAAFHASCAWEVKATRGPMRRLGWAPSVTLFEAAACGVPLISDRWPGFEQFFSPGEEALLADTRDDVLAAMEAGEAERQRIGEAGRRRVLASHTYVQRVDQLEALLAGLGAGAGSARQRGTSPARAAGDGSGRPEGGATVQGRGAPLTVSPRSRVGASG